jgi:hypothetical protein
MVPNNLNKKGPNGGAFFKRSEIEDLFGFRKFRIDHVISGIATCSSTVGTSGITFRRCTARLCTVLLINGSTDGVKLLL